MEIRIYKDLYSLTVLIYFIRIIEFFVWTTSNFNMTGKTSSVACAEFIEN